MRVAAYRGFTASTGKTLARVVYNRCVHNVKQYARSHPQSMVQIGRARTSESWTAFQISGASEADIKRFLVAQGGAGSRATLAVEPVVLSGNPHVRSLRVFGSGPIFGWLLNVGIDTKIDGQPAFEVRVETDGKPPAEILRCLEATYNEIVERAG